ncbi:MAG: glycosyltransferase [Clostridia bacterium]|nr:glycosyltransferase [Clostridia bacterium]
MEKINYSVLMSVYYKENPEWLDLAINSMLNQTILTNDFVIIKDGPLTNELDDVINKYLLKYPNLFNIVALEKNVGLGAALKIGVEKCKNEWIARMDSDDYSIPTRCEKQLKRIIENPNLDIVGSCIAEFEDNIDNIRAYRILPENNEEILNFSKKRNPFGHPSVMLKKSKVIEAGNYESWHLCEDYELWVRMIENGAKCYNFKENLVYMRVNDNFYKRRGGIKYLKSILKLKTHLYRKRFFSFKQYFISSAAHIFICLLPNKIRVILYKKILRKSVKS